MLLLSVKSGLCKRRGLLCSSRSTSDISFVRIACRRRREVLAGVIVVVVMLIVLLLLLLLLTTEL